MLIIYLSYRPSLHVFEEIFCCFLLIAPEILLWPALSHFNVSSARMLSLLSTSLRYDFILLLGKHPHFYLVPLFIWNKNGELGFVLAEAITLCTLWSLVEQITNCKVLNQTLHIVQPKAALSLKGFATSCTTEPYSAGTKDNYLISQHGICSTNTGRWSLQPLLCFLPLLSPWPPLTCHKQHCHDGQALSSADLTLFSSG